MALNLNLGTSFTLRLIFLGKAHRYSPNDSLDGPQNHLDVFDPPKKILLPLPGIESRLLTSPACSQVAISTELFRVPSVAARYSKSM
jgi:hypothetical protein